MCSSDLSTGVGLVAGALIALPSLRTSGHYFVILTFAIGEVITVFEMRLESLTGGVNGITTLPGAQTLFGLRLGGRADYYVVVVGFAAVVFLVLLAMMRSRWGVILRSMRDRYYAMPRYLPKGHCDFCERYSEGASCPVR